MYNWKNNENDKILWKLLENILIAHTHERLITQIESTN